jgi:branched-subunit amino acid aminotransferase/4-amino-4-deoxychorismate lyase
MHKRVSFNNSISDLTKIRVPALTSAALYGHGVFTTLSIYKETPFQWQRHWERLQEHAARLSLDTTQIDEQQIKTQLLKLIEANRVEQGRARITLLSNLSKGPWKAKESDQPINSLITTGDLKDPAKTLSLTISPFRLCTLSPLTGVKSVNYLDRLLSSDEARTRDFDEAIMLNERGEISSATMANIFWVIKGAVHTPAIESGCIRGTTRELVKELAEELSIPVIEGGWPVSDLSLADEIFLTSSGIGVAAVTTYDFRKYTFSVGSVTLRLQEALRQRTLSPANQH